MAHEQIRELADGVKRSAHFRKRAAESAGDNKLTRLLDCYVNAYPAPPTDEHITTALNNIGSEAVQTTRLNQRLHTCFTSDASLWPDQHALRILHRKDNARSPLDMHPLPDILSPTQRFWFHQATGLPKYRDNDAHTYIVFAEPLFF